MIMNHVRKLGRLSSQSIKGLLKVFVPQRLVQARRSYLANCRNVASRGLSLKETFEKVYADGQWGKSADPSDSFFSGGGSHDSIIVSEYVTALQNFLRSVGGRPDVVDLGCGDFAVGSRIRSLCGRYVACDIVENLVARNKVKYKALDVDFRTLDITEDALPEGKVVLIRQVFQHLSNSMIQKVLPKLCERYEYLVLSEHLAQLDGFTPNLDKPDGPDTRTWIGKNGSGVVLTCPPFNLPVLEDTVLCTSKVETGGIVRTNLYRLRQAPTPVYK
jgi:hypothetical protein